MISALTSLIFYLGTASALAVRDPQSLLALRDATSCPVDTPLSCSSTSTPPGVDTCCFESPGGVLVLTQFWDYSPPNGPVDEFTIHGLWPDKCDGTYDSNCNSTLNVQGTVQSIVVGKFGDQTLYDYMSGHWKGLNGDEDLWIHEFNKHGTCVNTIHPECYPSYKQDQNIYDFYRITTNLHKKLPSHQYLAAAGITPSSTATYTKAQIQSALDKGFGHKVYFTCDSSGALNEVWYFHHLKGSLLGESFSPIDALSNSGCSATGIKYPPKTSGGGGTPTSSQSTPTSSSTGIPTSGYIKAGSNPGCLISAGKYYESGTCATFQYAGSNIKSSKGYCAVDSTSTFTCGSGIAATQFSFGAGNTIGFGGVSD